jgi:hypothetical protein
MKKGVGSGVGSGTGSGSISQWYGSGDPDPDLHKNGTDPQHEFLQCVTGGGRVVMRASTGVIHCVFDQIPNLQNYFNIPGGFRQINTCCQVPLKVNF